MRAVGFLFLILMAGADSALADDADWDVMNPPGEASEVTIDTTSGTWMTVDVSPDGETILFDMLGDLYVMPISGGEATSIASGIQWDMQPRFSPDGSEVVFISDRGGASNIWVMNSDGSNPRQISHESFRTLNNPDWSPDGNYIAARKHFTTRRSTGTGEIWLYHVAGGSGVAVVERPSAAHQKELGEPTFSPDGSAIYYSVDTTPGAIFDYVRDSNKQLFAIRKHDLTSGEVTTVTAGPGGAIRATPSPDGNSLAFIRRVRADSALFVRDLASGEERQVYGDLDQDVQEVWGIEGIFPGLSWTPDNASVVFWSGGKINRVEVASGAVSDIPFHVADTRKVIAPPRFAVDVAPDSFRSKMVRSASVSPDGNRVVYDSLGKLYVKQLPNGTPERLTRDNGDHFELFPSFSRDGRWVVFATWDDAELGSVRRVRSTGGRSRAITNDPGHYVQPRFSPDGETITFNRAAGGRLTSPLWSTDPGVYVMPADGGDMHLVTRNGRDAHFADANDRVVITRTVGGSDRNGVGSHELISVDLNGENPRVLAKSSYATAMQVSPDGNALAFRENYHVYMTPLTGAHAVQIGPDAKSLPSARLSADGGDFPSWSSDSSAVHWTMGPTLFSASANTALSDNFTQPSSGVDLSVEASAEKPSGMVAITGARIVTMDGDSSVIEDGTVLIDGNRIAAIGVSVDIPADAKRVDAGGKTILPGLIDIHAHGGQGTNGIIPQQSYVNHGTLALGVTTGHDPSNRSSHIFAASELQRTGQILAPRLFSTGEVVYGAKSELWARINSLEDARGHVRRLKANGAISIKNYNLPRRDARQRLVAAATEEGIMSVAEGGAAYHQDMAMITDGNTGIEHTIPQNILYEDVLQLWSGTKVTYTPTLVVSFGVSGEHYWYEHTDVWKHPILSRHVPPHILEPRSVRRLKIPDEDHTFFEQARSAKKLYDRGVSVHTGAHGQREGLGTHWEMWMFALGGMTEMEAIAAATRNPAFYLGLDGDVGSLEVGKLADLLIINGNPLENIRDTDKIEHVMLNGRLYEAATLNEVVTGDRTTRPYYWH